MLTIVIGSQMHEWINKDDSNHPSAEQVECHPTAISSQWRHNERDGVSNHQPHDCLFSCLFRRKSKKTSKLRVTGLCEGNSPVTGEFPAQKVSNAANVSIWWRHHVFGTLIWSPLCLTTNVDMVLAKFSWLWNIANAFFIRRHKSRWLTRSHGYLEVIRALKISQK